MPGMLYQVVNRERKLLEAQGRKHAADLAKKNKPRLVLKEIPRTMPAAPEAVLAPAPMPVPEQPAGDKLQTVGLHNVPSSLVDALKAEAKRRSVKGKRVTMTEVALDCFQIGLAELSKQSTES